MGFFSKKPSYPELDSNSPVAGQVQEVEEPLKELMKQVSDPLEVVPSNGQAYVFIGKPPKKFGLAMIEGGKVQSFVAAAKEKGLEPVKIQRINERFREAYEQNLNTERYTASVAGKEIVVTPCKQLAQEVEQIISSM